MKRIFLAVIAVALAAPAAAQTLRTTNNMTVTAAAGDRFVVSGVPHFQPQDYWCAAGQYAQRVLRASQFSRLYVVGDYQRGQRTVTFSTSPAGTAAAQGEVNAYSIRVDGANLRLDAAVAECRGLRFLSRP